MHRSHPQTDTPNLLAPLLPAGQAEVSPIEAETADRLAVHWSSLEEMGFELTLGRNSLRVRHRDRGFETVIQLSHDDDLGERRALFLALRSAFGRTRDRFFSWLFQPSPSVSRPYESLREVIAICQSVRARSRSSS